MLKYFYTALLLIFCLICTSDAYQNRNQNKTKANKQSDTTKLVSSADTLKCCKDTTQRCDTFIDKDGDGINDNRCRGFGVCKHKNQHKEKKRSK